MEEKVKFFIFSDESGSWHDPDDIYIRSWVIMTEDTYKKLQIKIDEISDFIDCKELKWSSFSGHKKYFDYFKDLSFRVFVTISSPKDIPWTTKYKLTRNFDENMKNFDFGELDTDLVTYIKDRIFKDLKNALFLNFYEKYHIENAKIGIEKVIKPTEYDLIYRIDPPQMSQAGWRDILKKINEPNPISLEFPKSIKSQGIQFADIIAGCFRSLFLEDSKIENSKLFFKEIKKKLVSRNREVPNPNLIFFNEIGDDVKDRCKKIWGY